MSLLENLGEEKEKTVELLRLFQENFRSSEEYSSEVLKDKGSIVDAYMAFAEAKIMQTNATSQEELKECWLKFNELETATTTPDPLKKRIAKSMQELDKTL